MAKIKQIQAKISDKVSEVLDSARSTQKNALYVVLGAYDIGAEKISDFRERTQSEMKTCMKRGEKVESELSDKFDEFKNSENAVAKSVANVEKQIKELGESTEEQYKKVSDQVADIQEKMKDQIEQIKSRFEKGSKPAAKKVTRKSAAKKPAAKKAPAKKAAARKAPAKQAAA